MQMAVNVKKLPDSQMWEKAPIVKQSLRRPKPPMEIQYFQRPKLGRTDPVSSHLPVNNHNERYSPDIYK